MMASFAVRHALREARSGMRRFGMYTAAITLGVAALVAINAYRANIVDAVRTDAQRLLGGDVRLQSDSPFPDSAGALLDSLTQSGARVAHVTATLSMGTIRPLSAPDSGGARLVQLRAIDSAYPFYDEWRTTPPAAWPPHAEHREALVEPSLLLQADAQIGDSVQLGRTRFRIAGTVDNLPGELGFRGAAGPRVYIARAHLEETGLVTLGSITRHQAFVQLDRPADAQRFVDRYHDRLRGMQISFETAEQQGEELAEAVSTLSRFLGLVGLTALLLGGLGVGSAVNVFVREKRAVIATLRCLGTTQAQAFTAYLLQAALLGLAGATAGVVLGTLVQAVLPHLLQGALPFDVDFRVRLVPILSGLAVGLLVAVLFALLPLLEIRGITPLQAIRQEVEPVRRRLDPLRAGAWLLLAAGVTALAIWQAGDWRPGIAYAAAIATAILLLLVCASVLVRVTRRWFPERASFVVRQGIASLFRPHNQTTAVTVALGFGVFIISAMLLVQHNLVKRFDVRALGSQPNLVGFGIQAGQRDSIAATLSAAGAGARIEPIVTARIAAINGVPVDSLLNSARARDIEPWALRREYRNTYRDTLTATETLVAGEWFDQQERGVRGASLDVPARVSIEEGVAGSLDVGIGDRITWDVQGREVESVITSVRQVDWARLETNYFVVFEPGSLERAPQSFVLLARLPGDTARADMQRVLARAFPNVTTIDLAAVQQTFERIVFRATLGIRFMGLFTVIGGVLVLAGAIAASRYQRLRETVLLRTLGAQRGQIRAILLTEYAALGALAALAGGVLGTGAAWALVRFVFEFDFAVPLLPLALLIGGTVLLAVLVGAAGSRPIVRNTPLEVLRGLS
ncbi:MAG TPA: FtsX-like permease family protein [Longimicrobiales bacterium]|nr:FtsX-like permease family protein [Longimicrobiales bacterium]